MYKCEDLITGGIGVLSTREPPDFKAVKSAINDMKLLLPATFIASYSGDAYINNGTYAPTNSEKRFFSKQ
jgi:hypothetical protein